MKLKSLAFFAVCLFGTTTWADFSGHYSCKGTHRDKKTILEVDLALKGNTYEVSLKTPNGNYKHELIPTKDSKIFLTHWQSKTSVGVSEWQFQENKLNLEGMFFDSSNGKKYTDKVECIKNK